MNSAILVRNAIDSDAALLADVERSAGAMFRSLTGYEWVADDIMPTTAVYRAAIETGPVWVAHVDDNIVAFLIAEFAADDLHIDEVSVQSNWQGRGIGRRLIETAIEVARSAGRESVTLTTFRHVPWNAPYYERLGFAVLETPTQRLELILDSEQSRGFAREDRCVMQMMLTHD